MLFASPPYMAVIECCPTAKFGVVNVVAPVTSNVPVPNWVEPSLNVIVPVGTLSPFVVTVTVNVTEDPDIAGFALDVNAVVVLAWTALTVWISTAEVLDALLASPP